MAESSNSTEIQISLPDVVKFIRQLAHDLRNHLNAAELQATYLAEIADNDELREETRRLRGMISQVGANLQQVTAALSQPRLTPMDYAATDLMEDLRQKIATDFPAESADINWSGTPDSANLNIDPQLLLPALVELFANAFRHGRGQGPLTATASTDDGRFTFTLSEPKQNFAGSMENWGREPLRALGQGHYGLGLHRTRAIVEAHGGDFSARYDAGASTLITTISFPLAPSDA
jgi:signal transduction histidine kinase